MKRIIRAATVAMLLVSLAGFPVQAAAPQATAMNISVEGEGRDAIYVFSPRRDPVQTKQQILNQDKESRNQVLTMDEAELKKRFPTAQATQGANQAPRIMNAFNGVGTGNGAVLVAYDGFNPRAWCAWFSITGYCHAGIWNQNAFRGRLTDKAVRTANTAPLDGIQDESAQQWRGWEYVREMQVTRTTVAQRAASVTQALGYAGTYTVFTGKGTDSKWYCSKVVWRAYADITGADLDASGGYWVSPGDVRWAARTATVRVWA